MEHPPQVEPGLEFMVTVGSSDHADLATTAMVSFNIRIMENGPQRQLDWWSVLRRNEYKVFGELFRPIHEHIMDSLSARGNVDSSDDFESACHAEICRRVSEFHSDRHNRNESLYKEAQKVLNPSTPTNNALLPLDCFRDIMEALTDVDVPTIFSSGRMDIFMQRFKNYWATAVEGGKCEKTKQLPFTLRVNGCMAPSGETELYNYQPMPDMMFLRHGFPLILIELDTGCNHDDEKKLQVMLLCSLRLAIGKYGKNEQFFLMGILFTKARYIHRFLCFKEEHENKICFHERIYDMKNIYHMVIFWGEIYNYAFYTNKSETRVPFEVGSINSTPGLELLTTTRSRPSRRDAFPNQMVISNSSARNGSSAVTFGVTPTMMDAVHPGISIEDLLQPPGGYPNHIERARAPDGTAVLVKHPRDDYDFHLHELNLLRELSQLSHHPHNHVVPLLGTVERYGATCIVLPKLTSFDREYICNDLPRKENIVGEVAQLSRELVEGLAFLHRQGIAHLDIKPANLVYSHYFKRLYIIDLESAVRCGNADTKIDYPCGTRGWCAPEIVMDKDKLQAPYSPIRADLYSCGLVLRYIAEKSGAKEIDFWHLSELLMVEDAQKRPLLQLLVEEAPKFWAPKDFFAALNDYDIAVTPALTSDSSQES